MNNQIIFAFYKKQVYSTCWLPLIVLFLLLIVLYYLFNKKITKKKEKEKLEKIDLNEINSYYENQSLNQELDNIIKNGIKWNNGTLKINIDKEKITLELVEKGREKLFENFKKGAQSYYSTKVFDVEGVSSGFSGIPSGIEEKLNDFIELVKKIERNNSIIKPDTEKKIKKHFHLQNKELIIKNIEIYSEKEETMSLKGGHNLTRIKIINSMLENIDLNLGNTKIISIENSIIRSLDRFSKSLIVEIINSRFGGISYNYEDFKGDFYFDKDSFIKSKYAKKTYSKLKRISLEKKDILQAHIFHIKELEEYKKSNASDGDDELLISLSGFLNKSGLSFVIPILGIFVLNSLIVFIASFYISNTGFCGNILNISPFHSIVHVNDNIETILVVLDSIRRVGIGIFIYLIIMSGTRFRFKK